MSEPRVKPKPSYAPVYAAALYPQLATIAREEGYALAVHGSLARDMDLIAVPWTDTASDPSVLIQRYCAAFSIKRIGEPELKTHNRLVQTISIGFGECFIDLSFMPRVPVVKESNEPTQIP